MRILVLVSIAGCLPDLGERSAAAHARDCATCHPEHAERFGTSRHARAAEGELFVALRERAQDLHQAGAYCDRCHAPASPAGLDCLTCHAAADALHPSNGALVHDPTGPVRGPFGDSSGPHASAAGELLTASALCGTCHDQDGLPGFSEQPYQHWLAGPAAAHGVRCQDCHMSSTPGSASPRPTGPIAEGAPDRPISDHGFVGLQTGGPALIAAGVELVPTSTGVDLRNLAGHDLPDGASFLRELWLEARTGGVWSGDRRPLHAELLRDDEPVWDPNLADRVVLRGVPAGAVRHEALPAGWDEVCLRFRPVSEGLSVELGVPVQPTIEVVCVGS